MTEISRRSFLRSASAALPLGVLGACHATVEQTPGLRADLIVRRGNLLTMDPAMPRAEAMAIQGDSILAVGSDDDLASSKVFFLALSEEIEAGEREGSSCGEEERSDQHT